MSIRDDIYLSADGTPHPLCTSSALSSEGCCVVYGDDVCSSKLQVSAMCARRQFLIYIYIYICFKGIKQRNRKQVTSRKSKMSIIIRLLLSINVSLSNCTMCLRVLLISSSKYKFNTAHYGLLLKSLPVFITLLNLFGTNREMLLSINHHALMILHYGFSLSFLIGCSPTSTGKLLPGKGSGFLWPHMPTGSDVYEFMKSI